MVRHRRLFLILGTLAIGGLLLWILLSYLPLHILSVHQKPEQPPQKIYDYYIIMEETTGAVLMRVPLIVSVGDELISEDNKRYRIVKVEENRAYARYIEDINIDQPKPQQRGR